MTAHTYRHGMTTTIPGYTLTPTEQARAAAYAEQTRRIAEIRRQLVADGMDWSEANDEAVERVLIAADHHSADDASDANQQETR